MNLKGIQIYYDPSDDYSPPYYAVDCDAVWEKYKHIKFTEDQQQSIEALVEGYYGLLAQDRLLGHGWSEAQAIQQLKSCAPSADNKPNHITS